MAKTATHITVDGERYDLRDAELAQDVSDLKSVVEQIDEELFDDQPINLSGSWTKNYAHNFTPNDQVLLTVDSSTENRMVAISTIEDMDNPSVATRIFVLSPGQKVLWIPDKNYEGLQISVNGSCVASATIYSGAFSRVPHTFYCGPLRDYKTIKSAVEKATQYMDSVLYVDAGTYNLIDEFGAEYFENLTSTDIMTGISLKNRVHIFFDPNSKVVCNYTGSNQYAQSLFSPFTVGQFGFTLENLTLECSRCRYAVHDERNGGTEYCESNYINCNMKIDNSDNQYFGSTAPTVIGGGLGANHVVNINNCIFDTSKDGAYSAGVYYHQSNKTSDPNHKCILSITSNYFKRGLLSFQFERTDASEDTNIIVNGNSFPQISGQDAQGIWASGMTGTHTNLYAWNNIIRSA